jgi:hypothetical protein
MTMQWRISRWKWMAQKRSAVEEGGGEPSSGNTADPQLIML